MSTQPHGGQMHFWVGEVRNKQDPDEAGKCQVIVHGYHNAGNDTVKDDDLPWAHCLMNNSPSVNKIGQTNDYLPGSTVIGFWLDPETKRVPVIIGSLHRAGFGQS
jgi:hypothetical protein